MVVSSSPTKKLRPRLRALMFMLGLIGLTEIASSLHAQSPNVLTIQRSSKDSTLQLTAGSQASTLLHLEHSSNLAQWKIIATTHDSLLSYPFLTPTPTSPSHSPSFFRFQRLPRTPQDDWKNQISFPEEPFRSASSSINDLRWVKFIILLNDPTRVYYQDSLKYLFHYDFAKARLAPFRDLDRDAFDRVTLYSSTQQQAVLGAILYPPATSFTEYAVQFAGRDAFPPQQVLQWLKLVRATLHTATPAESLYMPAYEQRAIAESNRAHFETNGFKLAAVDRWLEVNHCYAPGWAMGKLKFFTASEIDDAFLDGRLKPEDILLTDGIPGETPLVAGIITLSPSTPNSHTAILAASFNIPFFYLADTAEQARVRNLDGHEVIASAFFEYGRSQSKVLDVEGSLTPEQRLQLLTLKQPPQIEITPKKRLGSYSVSTDALTPSDIRYFGGKASNYGLLRRSINSNSPPAIAFSFDLWDDFMDQKLPNDRVLRDEIRSRLASYTNDPPNLPSLRTNLAAIRTLIRTTATFTPDQQQAITNALIPVFEPGRKIRFRSSTNVEDTETFTGAGLYDSYSGCLLDDMDDDTQGPSECDDTWTTERGVFRAIQQVYASFYNDSAYLERLRRKVDESQVGMAILVHHSFPDEGELANGVATLRFNINPFGNIASGDMVTQAGATPVTNPDGSGLPEVVYVSRYKSFHDFELKQTSSLLPLGATVLQWTTEYVDFMNLMSAVSDEFLRSHPAKTEFALDFEYKKDSNLGLVIKQVRPLPLTKPTQGIPTFLIQEPVEYRVEQAETADVFSNHRLKSVLTLNTASFAVTSSNLNQTFYQSCQIDFIPAQGPPLSRIEGPMKQWPKASYTLVNDLAQNRWSTESGAAQRVWRLDTEVLRTVPDNRSPVITQRDMHQTITVIYPTPVPVLDYEGKPQSTRTHTVTLTPTPRLEPGAILRQHGITKTNTVTRQFIRLQTAYYWPKQPTGVVAGYTAPLVQFVETQIEGLTRQPILLQSYFSQTYRPGHHNFTEDFIFEPRLEPDLPPDQVAELTAANVQLIHVHWTGDNAADITVLGLDGLFRQPYPKVHP